MGRVPKNRRFKHRKRHKDERKAFSQKNISKSLDVETRIEEKLHGNAYTQSHGAIAESTVIVPSGSCGHSGKNMEDSHSFIACNSTCSAHSLQFHDYVGPQDGNGDFRLSKAVSKTFTKEPGNVQRAECPKELWNEVEEKLQMFLYQNWRCIFRDNALHVVLLSPHSNLSIQRNVVFFTSGLVDVNVHCQNVCVDRFLNDVYPPLPLQVDNVDYFVDRCIAIVNNVRAMEICGGFDDENLKDGWSTCPFGEVDKNLFNECRYVQTFRSYSCLRLVRAKTWRCSDCQKLYGPLKRRARQSTTESGDLYTGNKYLSEDQKLKKLQEQRRNLNCASKKLDRLQARMQELIQKEGVQIDDVLSNDLSKILKDGSITPAQSIFMQQQVKASQKKNNVGMRWHPTMIRIALSIYLTSASAYEMIRDTGMVKLPSSRTLFDYLHVKPIEEGIDRSILDSVAARLSKMREKYKKYHVLMADEMHISQNLIFQKSTGRLIGYTSLDDVDQEVKTLEQYLDNPDKECESAIATKVLTYMIKGVSSGIKEVVATYGVGNLSVNQMYIWTWEVIGALERSGVRVAAFVCDGCSINRSFIKKHTPITKVSNGVVFDTINKAARNRVLYFISDVPHLLKTIWNCMLNSRSDRKKGRRKLSHGGKKICWEFIIKLYNKYKGKTLRKAFKLSPMNVFPDSYARMKVKYAAEVLSLTVAQALEDEGWENAEETIKFIRWVNNWFDCLNGAHSSIGKRKRNSNLEPYTSVDDKRFTFLLSFLQYLEDWKSDAEKLTTTCNTTVETSIGDRTFGYNGTEDSVANVDEGDDNANEETPASKRILSHQTLEGIEMTTRAFINLVKFLLKEGTNFVNARVFTQDPLEQHFSKIRAGQGGSNNPNLGQVLNRNRAIHTIGQLGMKRKRGNTEVGEASVEVTVEALPRRKRNRDPKFGLVL